MIKSLRDAFGEALVNEAEKIQNIVAISCDLKNACKLDSFFKKFPNRSFEIGIAEANAIGIAAGLSFMGYRPFLASFGSFITGKNVEIRTTISYNLAPVVIVGTHGGLIGADGATQAALQDIAVMRTIPDIEIFQPCSPKDVEQLMKYVVRSEKPTYLRIGRNEIKEFFNHEHKFKLGFGNLIKNGKKNLIISSGPIVKNCIDAIKHFDSNQDSYGLLNLTSLKPIDENFIINTVLSYENIIVIEDHLIEGGVGSIISEIITKNGINKKIYRHGLNNEFIESDTPKNLEKKYKLDDYGIFEYLNSLS